MRFAATISDRDVFVQLLWSSPRDSEPVSRYKLFENHPGLTSSMAAHSAHNGSTDLLHGGRCLHEPFSSAILSGLIGRVGLPASRGAGLAVSGQAPS